MFKISIQSEEIEKMPLGAFPGTITVIEKTGFDFLKAVAYLRTQKIIGFDTETRPVFAPGQHHNHVALLQLSGPRKAYLFRVASLGMPKMLCNLMANPRILKVGAAVHDDVRGLQFYQKFPERGFVDLQKIAYEWGIRDKSVKKLAANILGVKISKSQQLSNWEAEELSPAQQMYAATDAWVCREMYLKLLQCEKHPLTPEQLNPPQPQPEQPKAPKAAQPAKPAAEEKKALSPSQKRRRRRKRAKAAAAAAEGGAQAAAAKPASTPAAAESAAADKPKPKHRRRHRKPKAQQEAPPQNND
ncbi:MAG: 3'-5' exonuclease domain-containing protein 2 [Bacteroidales bacterium]|nr:3'-5' exonuclease domain-containing protein 2 [Bacteroidales bacterium]